MRLSVIRTLARWGFRFARLLSRVNAWPFRFISLLRVNASVFWQNGMEVRLSLIRTLARWGFRFARLLSRVNARPFRFVTLLRVNTSGFWAKRNGGAFIVNHCIIDTPRTIDIPINDTPHVNDVPHYRHPAHHRRTASSTHRTPTEAAAPFRLDGNRTLSPARVRSNNHGAQ